MCTKQLENKICGISLTHTHTKEREIEREREGEGERERERETETETERDRERQRERQRERRIISAFIKFLKIKLLPAEKWFTLRGISHIKYSTLRKQSFYCH